MTRTQARVLSREEARAFYDRFGAKQDAQAFYEDRAVADLLAHADCGHARAVCEFGCGTGRFAVRLLRECLPADATYFACDQSTTMVELARQRLAAFGPRVEVRLTDGAPRIEAADNAFDRFVSNYVLDLLSSADIAAILTEAHRVLQPGGLLCLASLTVGATALSRLVSGLWSRVHAFRPDWVGGCRPIELAAEIPGERWAIVHHRVMAAFGVPSEVVVARKR